MKPVFGSYVLLVFLLLSIIGLQTGFAFSVKISSPRNGRRFDSCADITLKAEADIPDSSIKRIGFYRDGGRIIRSIRTAPWEYVMEEVPDGIYEISARLTNVNNEQVDSEPIQLFVGSVADGEKLKNGEFACGLSPWTLSLNGEASATIEIEPAGWLGDEASMAFIYIDNPGTENWHVMLTQPCPLDSGHTYEISFMAEVEETKNIGIDFQTTTPTPEGEWPVWLWQGVEVTNDTYEYGPFEWFCPVNDPSNEFKLAISENSQSIFLDAIKVIDKDWVKNTTDVDEQSVVVAKGYDLQQNYPNPFNPTTDITFQLPETEQVTLSIFNVRGRCVRIIADGIYPSGMHTISWDGKDVNGMSVPSGIYFYNIRTESFQMSKRMVLIE